MGDDGFLPKVMGGYWGIGLVEVVWKVCVAVVNFWLKRSPTLNGALHGFRVGRVTGKATFEAKFAHHLAGISYKQMFQVFLDVQQA